MPPPYQRRKGQVYLCRRNFHTGLRLTLLSQCDSHVHRRRQQYCELRSNRRSKWLHRRHRGGRGGGGCRRQEEEEEDWIVAEGTASESHSSHSLASLLRLLDEPSTAASPSLRCSINSGFQ